MGLYHRADNHPSLQVLLNILKTSDAFPEIFWAPVRIWIEKSDRRPDISETIPFDMTTNSKTKIWAMGTPNRVLSNDITRPFCQCWSSDLELLKLRWLIHVFMRFPSTIDRISITLWHLYCPCQFFFVPTVKEIRLGFEVSAGLSSSSWPPELFRRRRVCVPPARRGDVRHLGKKLKPFFERLLPFCTPPLSRYYRIQIG